MSHEHSEKLDYDEESLRDKIKRRARGATLIGTGLLSLLHGLSHAGPIAAIASYSLGEKYKPLYDFISNENVKYVSIVLVPLSIWTWYRDHKHHKHEKELRKENERLRELLKNK